MIFTKKILFTVILSYTARLIVNIKWQYPLNLVILKFVARLLQINIDEASLPLKRYLSINDLFTRDLIPESRPVCPKHDSFVSPVDCQLLEFSEIKEHYEIKNSLYDFKDLIPEERLKNFENGCFVNCYLSPKDCHHIYAPCDFEIRSITHIPGSLLPVNPKYKKIVLKSYQKNERVILEGIKDNKTFFITLIGALFVGSIQVYQFEYLNQFSVRTRKKTIQINSSYSKGTKIATFHLGSTVVCFFPEGFITKKTATPFTSYKYGEALGIV